MLGIRNEMSLNTDIAKETQSKWWTKSSIRRLSTTHRDTIFN